jgi:hypothetical protein
MKIFNWLAYWERTIPPPVWVERLDNFIGENQDLDYFSLIAEGIERSCPLDASYAKFTTEQFKFDDEFNEYYGE